MSDKREVTMKPGQRVVVYTSSELRGVGGDIEGIAVLVAFIDAKDAGETWDVRFEGSDEDVVRRWVHPSDALVCTPTPVLAFCCCEPLGKHLPHCPDYTEGVL